MKMYKFIIVVLVALLYSCGTGGGGLPDSVGGGGGGDDTEGTSTAASITLSATPSTLKAPETSTITATVLDSSGANVADGTVVSFSVNVGGTVTASATTTNGIARVTFTASATTATNVVIRATSGSATNSVDVTINASPDSVTLAANPATVSVLGTSSIQATVLDAFAANIADGQIVTFTIDNSALGTVSATATTVSGIATAVFTAKSLAGSPQITATAGGVSDTISVGITAPEAGSIVFTSATPQVLGIKGFGQEETSLVIFTVNDVNGNPVIDGTAADFVMSGPGGGRAIADGGEYIGEISDPPTTASGATVNGQASVILHSGTLAGPVTIVASVDISGGVTISSSSSAISIGGGVPSSTHFSIASSVLNLAGYTDRGSFGYINIPSTISAFVADRFGNYNILENTSISFYAEGGAIDNSALTDATGSTSVTFRTQAPLPSDVAANAVETTLISTVSSTWDITTTYHPRDGRVAVLATVSGEEAFNDANANGIYDTGESFDDVGEPFYDRNDDGCRNTGTQAICEPPTGTIVSTDPFEEFIDTNGNSAFDIANGCWDGPNPSATYVCADRQDSKMLFKTIKTQFSGHPLNLAITCDTADDDCDTATSFSVANSSSLTLDVLVADVNLHAPIGGTTIVVTKSGSGGELIASPPSPIADQVSSSPVIFTVIISDNTPATTLTENVTITVEVTWKDQKYSTTISGTVD